jgi:hypothetical protein
MNEPKRNTKSGEHPAVKSYRRKIESISERHPFDELDKEIDAELEKVRSTPPPPPPPPDDPAGTP